MDYLGVNNILSFAKCENRSCVSVTIVDDMVNEPIEFFDYTLERTPGLDMRITLTPTDGRVQIDDDDGKYILCTNVYCSPLFYPFPTVLITVGYEFTVYTTSEGQGMVELSVIIFEPRPDGTLPPGQAPRPFTLSVSTEDGTAGIYMYLFIVYRT